MEALLVMWQVTYDPHPVYSARMRYTECHAMIRAITAAELPDHDVIGAHVDGKCTISISLREKKL